MVFQPLADYPVQDLRDRAVKANDPGGAGEALRGTDHLATADHQLGYALGLAQAGEGDAPRLKGERIQQRFAPVRMNIGLGFCFRVGHRHGRQPAMP